MTIWLLYLLTHVKRTTVPLTHVNGCFTSHTCQRQRAPDSPQWRQSGVSSRQTVCSSPPGPAANTASIKHGQSVSWYTSAGTHHGQSVSWYTSWTVSQLVRIMDSQSAGTHQQVHNMIHMDSQQVHNMMHTDNLLTGPQLDQHGQSVNMWMSQSIRTA